MPHRVWPLLALLIAGCSRGGAPPARDVDGGYRIACAGPLTECLERAEKLCRDQGYSVVGQDRHELLGHESGQSQVEVRRSEAVVYCGKSKIPEQRTFVETRANVTPAPAPPATSPPAHASKPTPAPVCVPGSTQACVGPGGCSGGQACAPDGTRFEPCDCGKPTTVP